MVIYAPANSNQSHFVPVALNVQSTTPGNFVYTSNTYTTTDSTYVDVPLNTQTSIEKEKNDQQGMYPYYKYLYFKKGVILKPRGH